MQSYMKAMKVLKVGPPYDGATGLQFEIYHPSGTAFAVYRDYPWPPERLLAIPPLEADGVFSLREKEWWAWLLKSEGFESPGKALEAACETAKQHVLLHGLQAPIPAGGPIPHDAFAALVAALRH